MLKQILTKTICFCIVFLLSSCAWFDGLFEEEEIFLPGTREKIFEIEKKKLTKSNLKVILPEPKLINEWPQSNQNNLNHLFHFLSNEKLKKSWTVKIGKGEEKDIPYIVSPIAYKNIIFTIDNNSKIQARDSNLGTLKWSKILLDESNEEINFIGGMSIAEDYLFVSTGLGNVYALNYLTGEEKWKKNIISQISAPPSIKNKKLFITSDDNQLFVIDMFSGENIWTHSGNLESVSIIGGVNPAIYNSIVYVTYSSGEIFALNEKNGNMLWDFNINDDSQFTDILISDIQSPAVIHENSLFVSNSADKLISLNLLDGEKNWDLNISTINPIVLAGNFLFVLTSENIIYSIDKLTGNVIWGTQLKKFDEDEKVTWVGPLLTSYKLILASSKGTILSLSPYSGNRISQIDEKEGFLIQPIQANKNIYFLSREGNLISFE